MSRIERVIKLAGWLILSTIIATWSAAAALEWSGSAIGFLILVATWMFVFFFALANM